MREFGIYVDEDEEIVSVFVEITEEYVIGADYPIDDFEEDGYGILSNTNVNEWLQDNYDVIGEEQVYELDTEKASDIFKNCGYIGQVNDYLQENLKNFIMELYEIMKESTN